MEISTEIRSVHCLSIKQFTTKHGHMINQACETAGVPGVTSFNFTIILTIV